MNEAKTINPNFLVAIVLTLTILSGFTIDFYAPSFPAIEHYFNIPQFYVRLIIPTYLLSYAIGYLVIGIISDHLGRKRILIISLCVFIFTSLCQAVAPTILFLLIFHFFQGLSASAPDVLGRSIIADKFSEKELAKKYGYISVTWSVCPIVAPILGGYLQHFFDWRSLFVVQTIYCLFLLLLIKYFLPETIQHSQHLSQKLIKNFKTIVTSNVFIGAAICRALSFAIVLLFSLTAPFLIQNVLHRTVIDYAHIAFVLGVFTFVGAMTNRVLLSWLSINQVVLSGFCLMIAAMAILFGLIFFTHITLFWMIVAIAILFAGRGFVLSNTLVPVLERFKTIAGTANAYSGTALIIIATVISFFASFLKVNSIVPLAFAYGLMTFIMFFAYLFLVKPAFKKEEFQP